MLHELTHRVLDTPGDDGKVSEGSFVSAQTLLIICHFADDTEELYGIIRAVRLATNPDPNNVISRGRFNADTFNLFAISKYQRSTYTVELRS
jgi:hypothetical protein